ncbi:MAG: serine dehydratase subunit alpha family protein [Clostridia bacterium]|nr:serine dehydratase subunit alpha family protein [Clostridia bacterium]
MLNEKTRQDFLCILKEELIPAMGCTEPIALAFASARAREVLGCPPEKITAYCSGNIIKNVRCVAIPNSDGLTGIEPACALGAFGGDAHRLMEVLEAVTPDTRAQANAFLNDGNCKVEYLDSEIPLHFIIEVKAQENVVSVEVRYDHINIVRITQNGNEIFKSDAIDGEPTVADRSALSIENIKEFADTVDISLIKPIIERVIQYNMDIAYEGMAGDYGVGIGRVIRDAYPEDVVTRMRAYAAAASEARMDGCDMPVIINSGSGNQGIASSVPVIVYAREKSIPQEKLYRALVFSGLMTVYQKEFIGKLSAFCGAISASCAAGASITYIVGGSVTQIKNTIDNTLANIPGVICDGAKTSCAAKIASALDAAMLAHALAMRDKTYEAFTGVLKEDAGETISCVGYIGKVGMKQTDKEIVRLMLQEKQI